MRITCPYCHSEAALSPNPAHRAQASLPVYVLTCSGCAHTSVRPDNQEMLVAALVGTRHGNGSHELTVGADRVGHIRFHTDPTGQRTPIVEHSEILEFVTRGIGAGQTLNLLLRTVEVGSRYHSAEGNVPYKAVRGWVVVDGEFRALSRQEVWEASCRDSVSEVPLDPEAGVHYVDADDIPRPYQWELTDVTA